MPWYGFALRGRVFLINNLSCTSLGLSLFEPTTTICFLEGLEMRSESRSKLALLFWGMLLILALPPLPAVSQNGEVRRQISIEWKGGDPQGQVLVSAGAVVQMRMSMGTGEAQPDGRFVCRQEGRCRIEVLLTGTSVRTGSGSTIVTVKTKTNPFSFFLRDVDAHFPIYIPAYQVCVTEADDPRTYDEITTAIHDRGTLSDLQLIKQEPEETFSQAASRARQIKVETWLGLSRDFRIFAVDSKLTWIEPRFHAYKVLIPETGNKPLHYRFQMGRGTGPADHVTRGLEDGVLPILNGTLVDGCIRYELTAFVTLENSPLTMKTLRGTHFLVADGYGFTDDPVNPAPAGIRPATELNRRLLDSLIPQELNRDEETVLMMQVKMVNTGHVPRYAFFHNPTPESAYTVAEQPGWHLDPATGFGEAGSARILSVSKLDGKPLPADEISLLLRPGQQANIQIYLPHRPISRDRALRLVQANFEERHRECREFWQQKLASAAQIHLPEKRIDEMLHAGLLHLDLVLYGLEPSGTLAPMTGVYNPIGTESSPIIQFSDSVGWHDVARRSSMFFLDEQLASGLMINYGDYMMETAGALYTMGEHYRYTHDDEWVKQIEPKLLKSADFIVRWRHRNLRPDLRDNGYGLLAGKAGDPQDFLRSFMFNSYHYVALERVAEMLAKVDPLQSQRLAREAEAYKEDIRTAFFQALALSPVMPLGDGTWCPTAPPWVEDRGALALHATGGDWGTLGPFPRESLVGPEWLIPHEVIQPDEAAAGFLLNFHHELLTDDSAGLLQPYYSQHPLIHLLRGEPEAFLKAYYNTLAPMADRETYTFHEDYGGGPHKTHEEAQFLMQTRYMLYLERGETLDLLPGVPRAWLQDGQSIQLQNVATYFGPLSLTVQSKLADDRIEASVECNSERHPRRIELRIPHPDGRKATWVKGGRYDPDTERVIIEPFNGRAEVTLGFGSQS
jgi:hypothetical protein